MQITLNDAEQKLARYLAQKRYQNARSKGIENKRIGDQSDAETDLNGIGAEIAFCKLMNVYPDLQTEHIPDNDALLRNGMTVDVKATKYRNGHLIAAPWKSTEAADIYALMVGTFPNYRFAGWASGSHLLQSDNKKDLGHGEGYALTQDQLQGRLP